MIVDGFNRPNCIDKKIKLEQNEKNITHCNPCIIN